MDMSPATVRLPIKSIYKRQQVHWKDEVIAESLRGEV